LRFQKGFVVDVLGFVVDILAFLTWLLLGLFFEKFGNFFSNLLVTLIGNDDEKKRFKKVIFTRRDPQS